MQVSHQRLTVQLSDVVIEKLEKLRTEREVDGVKIPMATLVNRMVERGLESLATEQDRAA